MKLRIKSVKSLGLQKVCDITITGDSSYQDHQGISHHNSTTSSVIKKMFIAPPGMVLVEVDYSQAELRVVAELANEKVMIEWFKTGKNIHVATACRAAGMDDKYDMVQGILKDDNHKDNLLWTKRKKRAKTINFGILYEQSAMKLRDTLQMEGDVVSVEEAEAYKQNWFKDFPAIKKFMDNQHRMVKRDGFVKTMFGQMRRLDDIYSPVFGKMLGAQRQSTNSPVQGTCGQFTNFATVMIREAKLKGEIPLYIQQAYTVHDSIGLYMYPKDVYSVIPKIVKICEDPGTMKYFGFELKKVKMKVSPEVGINWGEIHDYNPWENYQKLVE